MPRIGRLSTPVFATSVYEPDVGGELRAVLPARCALATPGDGDCRVGVDHRRERTTGPCFPIAVVRCATHPLSRFTLYPPGQVPYGRQPIVICSVSGPLLLDPQTRDPTWDKTLFQAAHEAAVDKRWPPHSAIAEAGVRRTQGRHIERAGLLVGIHPTLSERERIATRLRVSTMTLRTARSQWSASWTTRGAAIVFVLMAVPIDGSLPDRLGSAGYAAGLWAKPRRWDPISRWVVARSDEPERPSTGEVHSRGPPPTTSQGAPKLGDRPSSSS